MLAEYGKGIFALSGCPSGEVFKALLDDRIADAEGRMPAALRATWPAGSAQPLVLHTSTAHGASVPVALMAPTNPAYMCQPSTARIDTRRVTHALNARMRLTGE